VARWVRTVLLGVVVVIGAVTPSAAAEPATGFSLLPRVGGPHASFIARFLAPYATFQRPDLSGAGYYLYARGPAPCGFVEGASLSTRLLPGERATIIVGRGFFGLDRPNWCPGRYVAHIDWQRDDSDLNVVEKRRIVSDLHFSVRTRAQLRRGPPRPGHFQFLPHVGGRHETFIARFPAPYRTTYGSGYVFRGRGPAPCRHVAVELPDEPMDVVRGDRVAIGIDPIAINQGFRESWCPGRYVGRVLFVADAESVPDHVIRSHIVFTVR
jgi:hypothetical protein